MMSMVRGTLAAAFFLAAVAPSMAGDALELLGGSAFVTVTGGAGTRDYVRTAGGARLGLDVVGNGSQALLGVTHTAMGLVVHSGPGGGGPLTTSLFRTGAGAATNPPFVLRDPLTGASSGPASVRTIALDPGEAGSVLLDVGHVLLPRTGQLRALALLRRASGEAVLADYDLVGGPVRRTPLGFTPPIGSNKGSFVSSPDGHVWAAFSAPGGIRLFDLGDLSLAGPLQPKQASALAMDGGFDPESTRVGIIAILIGLLSQPAPAVSYQSGDELVQSAFDGASFRTVAHQEIPEGAKGVIGEQGLFYFLLPYIEQDNLFLWMGPLGSDAAPVLAID